MAAVPAQSMVRHGEGVLLPAARPVGQVGVGVEKQRGAAALFPGESCPCRGREIICTSVCPYGCISIAVRVRRSLSLCCKYAQALKKGLWTPGAYLFKTESFPARPGVLLSLENLDKEVVLGSAESFLPAFLQVFYLSTYRLSGSP